MQELRALPKQTRLKAALMMYTAWSVWKEHNRRIFGGKMEQPVCIVAMIKEEIALRRQACGSPNVF
ncbi:hypothetical protein BAE44_0022315 [Dichanthelium oligosanthes]|uniref:Uncharacterized protein n=1 Tax=Dichanthelium oligosanthes TaxID=888268 RepID=A0A1E5UUV5_9POAL|nr:hypothetical protein BAE44_0022315 [Dichanthelium oligosanthes]